MLFRIFASSWTRKTDVSQAMFSVAEIMLKRVSLFSEAHLTPFLLHHKYIDFGYVLFHNVITRQLNTQRLPSALRERRPRAAGERMFWKHGGGSLSIFPSIKLRVPY